VQENCPHGSEGGEGLALPDPYPSAFPGFAPPTAALRAHPCALRKVSATRTTFLQHTSHTATFFPYCPRHPRHDMPDSRKRT